MEGRIFKIERYSLYNGQGIRTTIFLKGCPLRCAWCSNPESQSSTDDLMYQPDLCLSECRECVEVCPIGAIQKELPESMSINRAICTMCARCPSVCPTEALAQIGISMSVEDALRELCKDRLFYSTSGGGITISGGEPLQQPAFVLRLLKECKKNNLHTVLDTCGYGQWRYFEEILEYTDLVLYDLKLVDSAKHQHYTGVSNGIILNNITNIAKHRASSLIIRLPFIPGINDSAEDIENLLNFLERITFQRVQILPYHRLGKAKYRMLGRSYTLDYIELPPKAQINAFQALLMEKGFHAEIIV